MLKCKSRCIVPFVVVLMVLSFHHWAYAWGFFGHKRINRLAVYTLPPEMFTFFKYHINYLTDNSVNPDRRRYAVEGEAPRHYIDMDVYGDSAIYILPKYWKDAVAKFTEDTLMEYGIVPWHINAMRYRLIEAFKQGNTTRILMLAADLGHYIGDANVPLHTTVNYNGQLTNQYGIHGFWESRLPELFSDDYNFWTRKAEFIEDPQDKAWEAVKFAHQALDSVFRFDLELKESMGDDKVFMYDERNGITTRNFSRDFSNAYHQKLNGQVERRMIASIQMVGDFWYTCWIEAGQPNLNKLLEKELNDEQRKMLEEDIPLPDKPIKARPHEASFMGFHKLMAKTED